MTDYYIYNEAGVILQTGSTSSAFALSELWCPAGAWIAEGVAEHQKHYVKNHQLVELTEDEQRIFISQSWRRHEFNFELMCYPDARTIEQMLVDAKILKWNEIKNERAIAEYAPFLFNNFLFDADLASQQKIAAVMQISAFRDDIWTLDWTLANNEVVTLTRKEIVGLALSLAERTDEIYGKTRLIRNAIDQANSLEEIAKNKLVYFFINNNGKIFMTFNIKPVQHQVGYRFQNITLGEDGSLSATIQVGTLLQSPGEEKESSQAIVFNPIAQQGCYLQKDEVDAAFNAPVSESEVGGLRDVFEARLESALRQKGSFNF